MSTAPTASATGMPEPLSMREVLAVPTMRRLWYAQIVSNFGDFLALFAVISVLTFKLHATPEQVTGVQISYLLPIAVLGVLAGVFVDRWPLKPTLVSSDMIRAGLVLLLMVAHSAMSFYLVLAAISVVSSFFSPAQGVAIRSAVPLHGLRSANSLMQQVMFGMRIVGPPTAAFLVASFGEKVCFWVDAISFVASGSLIASLALSRPSVEKKAEALIGKDTPQTGSKTGLASIWPDMKQGIGFIVHHAALLFVILALASGMFVLGCFGPLIAVYVRDTLHASTKVFGVASAMIGVGMFAGVNVLNTFGKKLKNTTLVYAGLGGIAVGLVVLTSVPFVWATILGDLMIGFAVAGIVIPSNVMIQQETPAELMGRVGSTVMSLVFTAQIAGLVLSGQLAERIGVRHVFAVCAGMLVVLVVVGKMWMEPKDEGHAKQ
ncbi:MFS transporter [Granulicella sp. WH15]|uniref:MFS transporter n=1 Tax=Granulicella sp. WH15 TaxID=2602070 RepID=UPI001366DEB9|nr:MFS transporter [Granulicella sp. WH15]QHN02140.1 MFS transporter [Granulicella sp. WH15]